MNSYKSTRHSSLIRKQNADLLKKRLFCLFFDILTKRTKSAILFVNKYDSLLKNQSFDLKNIKDTCKHHQGARQ